MQIPLSIFLVLLIGVLLLGCSKAGKGEFHDDFLNYSISKGLQGFAALAVVLHHLTQDVTQYGSYDKGIINIFVDAGVLFTGTFFFFSGYGLIVSFMNKEDYLEGFISKRLPTVIVPFYVCNWLFIAVNLLFGYQVKPLELLAYVSGLVLPNDQMWFIVELIILYLAFYFIFRKYKPDNGGLVRMAVFIACMNIVSLLLGHDGLPDSIGLWFFGEWWYNTTWLFFVGMIVARYKERLVSYAKKKYNVLLFVGIVLFIGLHFATSFMLSHVGYWTEYQGHRGYVEKFVTFLVQCPMVIVFVLTFMLITLKLQFRNKLLDFFGAIALEMYLVQNVFITKFTHIIDNDVLFFVSVYVSTILLALAIHKLDQILIKGVRKYI